MTRQQSPTQGIGTQSSTQSRIGQQPPSQGGQEGLRTQREGSEGSQDYLEGAQSTHLSGQEGVQPGTPGGGQQAPQAAGGQQPGSGRGIGLDDALTNEMRVALHDFVQAANVTEWCAEQCIDEGPQMNECVRLCRDVADLARLNVTFLSRDSAFGPDLVDVFVEAADACARECAQHEHVHCQDCAQVLPRAIQSAQQMLASFQGGQSMQARRGQSRQAQGGQSMQARRGQSMRSQGGESMQPQFDPRY